MFEDLIKYFFVNVIAVLTQKYTDAGRWDIKALHSFYMIKKSMNAILRVGLVAYGLLLERSCI